jgi:hypothetical protein
MLALFVFLSLVRSKVVRATAASFTKAVSRSPIALVAFSRKNVGAGKRISGIFDSLSANYAHVIEMILVDLDTDSDLLFSSGVEFGPTIAVFVRGKFRALYTGDWAPGPLTEYCNILANDEIVELTDSFSVFEFQHKPPLNLMITDESLLPAAQKLQPLFAGLLRVAVLKNSEIALNYSGAILTNPFELHTENLNTLNESLIQNALTTKVQHVSSAELIGMTGTYETIVALVDERDPLMIFETMVRFRAISEAFGKRVSFQVIDFFNSLPLIQQYRINSFDTPLYLRHSKTGNRYVLEPYLKFGPSGADLVKWLSDQIAGVTPAPEKPVQGVPRLNAYNFIPSVLDAKLDVILLVAAPRMPHYETAVETLRVLIELFKPIPQVKCYEFNPLTEHVTGLELPKSEEPQFSIWPASAEPNGRAFSAQVDLKFTIGAILQIIKTPITEEQQRVMQEKVNELVGAN